MSSSPDKNYQLRPKRAKKGKYREMIGISSSDTKEPIEPERSDGNSDQNNCNVYLLPIIVSGPGESQVIATIEIDDPGNMIAPNTLEKLPERAIKSEADCDSNNQTKSKDDPLERIEEILKKNDELIESIVEGPTFKKRRRLLEDSNESYSFKNNKLVRSDAKTKSVNSSLTMEWVEEKLIRPLTEQERDQVEELLDANNGKAVIDLLFGSNVENRLRKCVICSLLIEGPDSNYESHYSEAHQTEASFVCELCGEVNSSTPVHYRHIQSHFKTRSKSPILKKAILNNSESSEEVAKENGDMSPTNSSNEPFVCDICGKTLKHQKSLYSHRRTHTDAKAVCHICGATLKSSRYLHHHLLLHKDVDKPHKCDKCDKAFHSSSALKVHHYYNHEEHPGRFQCTLCSKTFKAKQGLQFHMDSHSNEYRYECSYCQKRFRGFKTCRVHELRHREAVEPNKFSCPICGKFFKTRQTLKNHEDVHASFNRYQCSICEKRFKLKKSCLAHIRAHHNKDREDNTEVAIPNDEGQIAVQSLLNEGEEYVVTIEDGMEVGNVLRLEGVDHHHQVEFIVPDADVECEVANFS